MATVLLLDHRLRLQHLTSVAEKDELLETAEQLHLMEVPNTQKAVLATKAVYLDH